MAQRKNQLSYNMLKTVETHYPASQDVLNHKSDMKARECSVETPNLGVSTFISQQVLY
jgi:hypothetical protein